MVAASILFILSLFGVIGAINALRAAAPDRHPALRPWWFPAMLTAETVPLRIIIHGLFVVLLIWGGALNYRIGWIGLVLTIGTWLLYGVIQYRAARAKRAMAEALEQMDIPTAGFAHVQWTRVLTTYPYRVPTDVERIDDIEYAPGLHLDLYRRRGLEPGPHPAILQIHGGSWRGGNRRQQGRPLLHRLARQGWICVAASYPLAPEATFPEPLIGLKQAIAWMRDSGVRYGLDPAFIAVTGGSAGGHLAALVALTADRRVYQPGFEDADTSIQAAIPVYGIYDFLNRNNARDEWPIIPHGVMKADKDEAEAAYRAASPLDQVHPDAPPFLVIHGSHDSVVPPREAEHFVAELRQTSHAPVGYAEIPGATHAFDVLDSLRTHYMISGVARFLETTRNRQTVAKLDDLAAEEPTA